MTFWVLVGLVTLVALTTLWLPLLGKGKVVPVSLGSTFIVVVAVGLYLELGTWKKSDIEQADFSPEEMVASLASRLQKNPGTLDEYMMLGRSYIQLKRPADAMQAYAKAMELSDGNNPDVIINYAESRAMVEGMEGAASALFEQALNLDPANPKALWYGGIVAREKGDYGLAFSRWQKFSDMAPDDVKEIMAPRLAELSQLAGLEPVAPPPASPQTTDTVAGDGAGKTRVTVTAPDALTKALDPNTLLFVVAQAKAGGPPLAVVRKTVKELPLSVDLSDDNAMVPGNTISKHDEVRLSARIALRGTAIRQSGDLLAEIEAKVGSEVELVISQVVP